MIKIHFQDDQDALFKLCGGYMTRLIERGNVKSAASEAIPKSVVEQHLPDKDHFLQHMIIMGDTETYGQNRNGDGWSKAANQKYHPTFVSHGAYYREHNHRSKDLAIGQIKHAAYNEPMSRIELLVWGNIKKANDIYEDAKSGKQRSNSMSARVPYDRCNACDHKARTPDHYCKHARSQMNQWIPELKKYAFVWNDHPTYFDASDVGYPADRLAHFLEYRFADDQMRKAASAGNRVITGVEWAKLAGVCIPDVGRTFDGTKQAWFQKFIDEEQWMREAIKDPEARRSNLKMAFAMTAGKLLLAKELPDASIATMRTMRPGTLFGELAKRACVLPFRTFVAYATGKTHAELENDPAVKYAAERLPWVFTKLAEDGCGCNEAPEMFEASSPGVIQIDPGKDDAVAQVMNEAEKKFDVGPAAKNRMLEESAEEEEEREDAETDAGEIEKEARVQRLITGHVGVVTPDIAARGDQLAGLYGLYKIAAVADMAAYSGKRIDDLQITLLTAHNFYAR